MLNPILNILPRFTHQTVPAAGRSVLTTAFQHPGGNFFCNWCADTLMVTQSEGPLVYTTDCPHCSDPFASDDRIVWLIESGRVPALEGI